MNARRRRADGADDPPATSDDWARLFQSVPAPDHPDQPALSPPSGDDIIGALVAEYGPAIYRVARSVVRDAGLAEDVVQDTLLKVWQNHDSFRGDAPIRHWVLRIAHNSAVSMLRKRRDEARDPGTIVEHPDDGARADIHRDLEGRFAVDQLWTALDRLDSTSREIVVLRELEGLSYEEIGEVLGLPLPTVKTRLFRARRTLTELLAGWR
jgi:RNA polymerase sigma-70 factor (ECF subfamily)